MSSEPMRDPVSDALLTPKNAVLILIDYQPTQVNSIRSMDHQALVDNMVTVARTAKAYGLPVVHSSVNVSTGANPPPIRPLLDALGSGDFYDRTSINAWEDVEFRQAVEATGRRKLIMAALWRSAGPRSSPTRPGCGASSRPALASPPSPSRCASCSATGRASRRR